MQNYEYQNAVKAQAIGGIPNAINQATAPLTITSALSRMDGLNERLSQTHDRLAKIAGMLGALYPADSGNPNAAPIPSGVVSRLNDSADSAHGRMAEIESLIASIERVLG